MTAPDAVVLDLDGTLMDHEAAALAGLASLLAALERPEHDPAACAPTWFELEDRYWGHWRDGLISYQEQRRRRLRDFLPTVGATVAESELDEVFARYHEGYASGWVAYDDARPALERLRAAGLRLAVLTNGDQEQQTAKLRAMGVLDLCGPVVASSSTGAPKPHPAAYAAACAAVGAAPDRVLMVGDNHELDVLAARAAGLQAVHLDRSGTHPAPEASRIRSLAELLP